VIQVELAYAYSYGATVCLLIC